MSREGIKLIKMAEPTEQERAQATQAKPQAATVPPVKMQVIPSQLHASLQQPQTYGVGERRIEATNAIYLNAQEAQAHLAGLERAVCMARRVIAAKSLGFADAPLQQLSGSLHAMGLKHRLSGNYAIDAPLMIDPTYSGFPTIADFFYLGRNREDGGEKYGQRSVGDIAEDAWRKICHGKAPREEQMEAIRLAYFDNLSGVTPFPDFHIDAPVGTIDKSGRRLLYEIVWYGLEPDSNIPVIYQMGLEQDLSATPLERQEHPHLRLALEGAFKIRTALHDLGAMVDRDDSLHPKVITKVSIGPHFSRYTQNPEAINRLFGDTGEEELLQFEVARCTSRKARMEQRRGLLNKLFGIMVEKQEFTLPFVEQGLIVPFRLKQEIDKGQYRQVIPSTVYGYTADGEILAEGQ